MTISFLYPRHQIWLSISRVIRELATGFHNIGDKMPPWGQPLYTIQVNVCTWRLATMVRLVRRQWTVHYWSWQIMVLHGFDYHIRTSGMVQTPCMSRKMHKELSDSAIPFYTKLFNGCVSWYVSSISELPGVKQATATWDNFGFYFTLTLFRA